MTLFSVRYSSQSKQKMMSSINLVTNSITICTKSKDLPSIHLCSCVASGRPLIKGLKYTEIWSKMIRKNYLLNSINVIKVRWVTLVKDSSVVIATKFIFTITTYLNTGNVACNWIMADANIKFAPFV